MKSIILFFISLVIFSDGVQANVSNDFFCMNDLDGSSPIQFESSVKSCNGSNVAAERICQQNVRCVYLSRSTKDLLIDKFNERFAVRTNEHDDRSEIQLSGRTYASLTQSELTVLIDQNKDYFGLEFHDSIVTCQASTASSDLGPLCPSPNNCKDDLFYKPIQATTNPVDLINTFNAGGDTGFIIRDRPAARPQ